MSILDRLDDAAANGIEALDDEMAGRLNSTLVLAYAKAARVALLAQLEAEGFQVVPVEPTEEILEPVNGEWNPDLFPTTWHQMLAAAPKLSDVA
jgi:hypothetical protein